MRRKKFQKREKKKKKLWKSWDVFTETCLRQRFGLKQSQLKHWRQGTVEVWQLVKMGPALGGNGPVLFPVPSACSMPRLVGPSDIPLSPACSRPSKCWWWANTFQLSPAFFHVSLGPAARICLSAAAVDRDPLTSRLSPASIYWPHAKPDTEQVQEAASGGEKWHIIPAFKIFTS